MKQALHNERQGDSPEDGDSFLAPAPQGSGMMDVASSKAAAEVQAAMVIAKRFPRNEIQALERIKIACQRKSLAELAMYAYPRGGQTVTGPSIRLAEVLARSWGNIDCGIIELEQRDGESSMMSYAWDLETNARSTKVFTVKHIRKSGRELKNLDDPRDIYEMTANQGSRRLRACILSIIPVDVQDAAIAQCEATLAGTGGKPLKDRVTEMVFAFKDNFGVTQEMLEKRLGHRIDATIEQELVALRKIFTSLRDNMAKREDFFDMPTAVESAQVKTPAPAPAGSEDAGGDGDLGPQPGPDPLFNPSAPITSLQAMAKRDGVVDFQVVQHAKNLKLSGPKVTTISEMREITATKFCETWPQQLPEIKKITVST